MKIKKVTKAGEKLPVWYYGKAYEIYDRNRAIWYPIGIHAIVKTARFIRQVWNMYRKKRTWFDKEYQKAYQDGIKAGYFERVQQENKSKHFVETVRNKLGIQNNNIYN